MRVTVSLAAKPRARHGKAASGTTTSGDGMRVPLDGEVAWPLSGGEKLYWRGTATTLNHEFARQVPV